MIVLAAAVAGCSDLGKAVLPAPIAEVSPAALDFGTVATGDTATRTARVTNVGTGDLSGSVSSSTVQFIVSSGEGPFTLSPGETLAVTVKFVPRSEGAFTGSLSFGSGSPSVALSGIGQHLVTGPLCQVVPTSLTHGTVLVGQSSTRSFVIRSVGSAPLGVNVVSSCPEFLVTSGGGVASIVPGDSLVVSVQFAPTTVGVFDCTVAVGPGCPSVGISGTGAVPPVSYSSQIQPIFTASCAFIGCHAGSAPAGRLNLAAGVSFGRLVNVVSSGYAPALRIKPGDLAGSVLYGKVIDSGVYGSPMPEGKLLTTDQLNKIAAWILQGAPNN